MTSKGAALCITMNKQVKKYMPCVYVIVVILISPLFRLSQIAWRNASVVEFVREFTNLVPLRGIIDAVMHAVNAQNISYLRPVVVNFLVMVPLGVYCGFFMERFDFKVAGLVCMRYGALFAMLYGIRILLKMGSFDIDDILLNLVGLWLGMAAGSRWKLRTLTEAPVE